MKKFRILAILLVMCLASSCFVGGTFAKYTSEATGSDNAQIAKWYVTVGDADLGADNTFTMDLFANSIIDTNDSAAEQDVATQMIAPGTKGQISFAIVNNSDVNLTYVVNFTSTEDVDTNIQFSLDNADWKDTLNELDIPATPLNMTDNKDDTITLYWKWDYDGDDTAVGLAARTTKKVYVSATVTATQVD